MAIKSPFHHSLFVCGDFRFLKVFVVCLIKFSLFLKYCNLHLNLVLNFCLLIKFYFIHFNSAYFCFFFVAYLLITYSLIYLLVYLSTLFHCFKKKVLYKANKLSLLAYYCCLLTCWVGAEEDSACQKTGFLEIPPCAVGGNLVSFLFNFCILSLLVVKFSLALSLIHVY